MIEEQGIIIALDGEFAEVRTQRRSACGGCVANGACGTSLIERLFGRRVTQLRALNEVRAGVGERVLVGISEAGLLSAALAVYLVPILGLVLGALVGTWMNGLLLNRSLDGSMADLPSVIGGLIGFLLALLWLRGYSAGSSKRPEHQVVILQRLH
ncbi:Fis family transcriptional regulator [Thiocapsa imhoffii]|uniref:Fis family transcriptional regulator n=1 Tax=Thiocapsa imhoffii TaxID=382777 RepID=A0A9X0WGE8_9GAMM|nr:SoxR reducing system RseC family protein [Thiocapsa imhoffii]MBK1644187.1 Fis family transcriptional regulator [Thiocapsa imhoffii]